MLKPLRAAALAILVCTAPSWVLGADFDGSKPLLCATIDAHFCDIGEVHTGRCPRFSVHPSSCASISRRKP